MATRVSSPTFVGRRAEMAQLRAVYARALGGTPGLSLIAGEAGVGKTRFVQEFQRETRAQGATILEGGCLQFGADGLPFGPFVEALRSLTYQLPPAELDGVLGSGRGDLARLLPQLTADPDAAGTAPIDAAAGQSRLFEHVLLLLERLALRAPIVLTIEDAHWADRSTIALLAFLARNLRRGAVVILVTYRTDGVAPQHPLVSFAAEQVRRGTSRVDVPPFDRVEITAQLEAITGRTADRAVVDRILTRSQGNAFYAEELIAAGDADGVPTSLREVLLARLASLSGDGRRLVDVAAVGGVRVRPPIVADVLERARPDVADALREALDAAVLVKSGRAGEEAWAFRHALVQEVAYGELLPDERVALHGAFARALTAAGPPSDPQEAAEVAHHWQMTGDDTRAFDAWIAAGRAAESAFAFRDAEASFARALHLWDRVPDAATRAAVERTDLSIRAAFVAGGWKTLEEGTPGQVRRAIESLPRDADPARVGQLYERLGQALIVNERFEEADEAIREAVRVVPERPPSAARSKVLSGLAYHHFHALRIPEMAEAATDALGHAEAVGDLEAQTRALVLLGMARVMSGDFDRGLADLVHARRVAVELGSVADVARAMRYHSHALFEAGDDEAVAELGLETERYGLAHGLVTRDGEASDGAMHAADSLLMLGRWSEAGEALERAVAFVTRDELGSVGSQLATRLRYLAALRGDWKAAEFWQRDSSYEPWPVHGLVRAPAEHALWQRRALDARKAVAHSLANVPPRALGPVRYIGLACWLGLRAEADLAGPAQSDDGRPPADRTAVDLLERTLGDLEQGVTEFRPAYRDLIAPWLAICDAERSRLDDRRDPDAWRLAADAFVGAPYFRAYALMREGEATLATVGAGARAAGVLAEGRAIAAELGAAPLLHSIEVLMRLMPEGRGVPQTATGTTRRGPFDLSPRELEVLALLADGQSDGEIAAALFISKKTASVHVTNIKGKLGASSRLEAVLMAMRRGLVEVPRDRLAADNNG